jgi:UDP-N-acetyl-D-mannosaminuronate dehydrogenase
LAKKLNQNHRVKIFEPHLNHKSMISGITNLKKLKNFKFDVIIISLAHDIFKKVTLSKLKKITHKTSVIFDLKNFYKNDYFETL